MALPRPVPSLAKAVLAAAVVVTASAVWLSGRFGEDAGGDVPRPAPAPLATLPRSETAATPASRPPPPPDAPAAPAPPVSVGAGAVTVPPPVPGAPGFPAPRSGQVVGEPEGLPDPDRSEAIPR